MAPDADTMASRPVATPRPKRSLPPKPTPVIAPAPASVRRSNKATLSNDTESSEPPKKKQKLKYIPGGPGGGGRYVDEDTGLEIPVGGTGPGGYNYVGPRGRIGPANAKKGIVPVVYPSRRDRSQRTRPTLPRIQQPQMTSSSSSAAQIAAAVQSDGYKPREERGWEEFHPDLDIDAPMNTICTSMVEETPPESRPITPARRPQSANGSAKGARTGEDDQAGGKTGSEGGLTTPSGSVNGGELAVTIKIPGTPGGGKRRPGRPPKDPIAFFTARALKQNPGLAIQIATPSPKTQVQQTPRITTVQNTNPKEKLILPPPSYRKSDTLARFEDKSLGLESYVEQSMANVGYQITDLFVRPEIELIKASDINLDEDPSDMRVEYDMDEQDCSGLQAYNVERKAAGVPEITREILEITLTKIEKEWHALEKRIPKPNPKPPQTHRPRSSSAAAVNGEPQAGEEQDSKCAICDDGDCENTNAIVFCDGCDLAVHQECYGVPFIPEGQWLCRKCLLIGRGIPTCIFCPNTDGAFKQTNATKWAHLLCSMWIPEVSLGNHSFMEPVQDVEKVPKQRWKLHCYICNQKMGACIQCTNKSCYDAFHVTCARKAGLFLKMKDSNGRLAIDENSVLQACCHRHTPKEYARENDVATTTRDAQRFYKKAMKGRIWADSQESALAMAAEHRHAITEHQPDESQLTGAKVSQTLADSKKKGGKPSNVWKLPSGAPVIPHAVFSIIESSLQRFNIQKRKDWTTDACRYWTLKREARRGAPLLKRLQLQMDTFPSMELTRRDFPGMGPAGKTRLDRRIAFAKQLVEDLEKLSELAHEVKDREIQKYQAAELQRDITFSVYFPVAKLLFPIMAEAKRLDEKKNVFTHGLLLLEEKVNALFYVTALVFAEDFTKIFRTELGASATNSDDAGGKDDKSSPSKKSTVEVRERKKHAKRIIKAVSPQFEIAVRAEAELSNKPTDDLLKELRGILDGAAQSSPDSTTGSSGDAGTLNDNDHFNGDTMAIDSPTKTSPSKRTGTRRTNGVKPEQSDEQPVANESIDFMAIDASVGDDVENAQPDPTVPTAAEDSMLTEVNGNVTQAKPPHLNGIKGATSTPPDTNGYVSAPEIQQPNPPTPPVSNGGIGTETLDTLTNGGIPLHFQQDFQIEGTNITEEPWTGGDGTESEDDLTDMDDEELRGLGADFEEGADGAETAVARGGTGSAIARTKKGRVKKRWRGYK